MWREAKALPQSLRLSTKRKFTLFLGETCVGVRELLTMLHGPAAAPFAVIQQPAFYFF